MRRLFDLRIPNMLLAIRDRTRGWIAYVIVALLVVPFALFGLYNYIGNGGDSTVASVDGEDITRTQLDQAYRTRQNELRQMLGERFDPAMFDTDQLRREALQQLIDQQLLVNHARAQNLAVSDQQVANTIRNQSVFQVDGAFSVERYRDLLAQNNLTVERYEASVRQDLVLGLLRQAVERSTFTSDVELDRILALQGQRRELAWAALSQDDYRTDLNPQPTELREWYAEHTERFQIPEQVRLRYVLLDPARIAEQISVSEEAIEARYRARQADISESAEREVRHILIEVPAQADAERVEQARDQALVARERIEAGEAFAQVAQALSDDPGSANNGGMLGLIQPDDVVPRFADAAWALESNTLSEPVRTDFGWHLIEVTDVRAQSLAPLGELRESLRDEIALERAEREVFELGNDLETLAFEYPNDLQPAAAELDLAVQESDWLSPTGAIEGALDDPAIQRQAFSDALLASRENSELIELEGGRYAVIRVVDYRPPQREAFADVREQVKTALIDEQAGERARADAMAIVEAVKAGEPLTEAAQSVAAATLNPPQWGERNDRALPAGVRETAFRLPAGDSATPRAEVARLADGWAAVVVTAVENADPSAVDAEQRNQLRESINRIDGQSAFRAVLASLREQADVRVFEERI